MLLIAFLLPHGAAFSEVQYSNFEEDLAKANSSGKTYSSGEATNKIADFDRKKVLRCWQEGQLISSDRGWKPQSRQAISAEFQSGSQEMLLYEFGETFCIYTGE